MPGMISFSFQRLGPLAQLVAWVALAIEYQPYYDPGTAFIGYVRPGRPSKRAFWGESAWSMWIVWKWWDGILGGCLGGFLEGLGGFGSACAWFVCHGLGSVFSPKYCFPR